MSLHVKGWLDAIAARLEGVAERPRREAELLMMAHLGKDQIWLITHPDAPVEHPQRLEEWTARRAAHEPLEYITGRVSFYSETFHIAPGALIPRPETELLIDEVVRRFEPSAPLRIAEVGVGSGIISVMLARHFPNARIIAVDISEEALKVARKNVALFGLEERIDLRLGNLLEPVTEPIDVLVSNPPYIADDFALEPNLAYEPDTALFGGKVGDEIIRQLLDLQQERHIPWFFCEMGYDQKAKVEAYVRGFAVESLQFYTDLAGHDRGFILRMKDA